MFAIMHFCFGFDHPNFSDNMKKHIPLKVRHERRFTGKTVEIPFLESVKNLLKGRGWHTQKYVFVEIFKDDPEYENAPYAESFVYTGESVLNPQL